MNNKLRPIDELFVDLLKCLLVVFVQFDFFPKFARSMCSFRSFHIEITHSLLFSDGSILRVGKRTGSAIAESSEIVLVSAEVLRLGFDSERAVLVVDDGPNYFVYNHSTIISYKL